MSRVDFLDFRLYQIQLFLVVCECKSFTTASQMLNTTQSAVSKSITSMETTLGFPLFERKKNRLELTEASRILYTEWKHSIRNIQSSIDKAYSAYNKRQSSLIIGEPDSMRTDKDYLPAIKIFQEKHPELNISFVEMPIGELISNLLTDELDVAITVDYEIPSLKNLDVKWSTIANSPKLTIIMHVNNPLAAKDKLEVTDLRNEEFIVMSPLGHQNYIDLLIKLCNAHGFEPKINSSAPNPRSMMSTLIRSQSGIVLGNRFLYDGNSPELKHFELDNTESSLIIVWKNQTERPIVNDFIKAVVENEQYKDVN